ncbi:tubulin delta chain-like [Anneissia japonica]|uniref:tubulin delta chain-like n=1 Tax=Anneissia japonica TaxID=1529436 RepID=UPI001425B5A1|nr:tubulin delta chain-like [Anneissia japonica]
MSIVTLQVGQCGNQVGLEFFNTIMEDVAGSATSTARYPHFNEQTLTRFFDDPEGSKEKLPVARAVLVDMETKVIQKMYETSEKSGRWIYGRHTHFCQKRGSGNNWANGFFVYGRKAEENVLNIVRKEVEKCSRLTGFLNLMSLAGGTGSGVGTSLTQSLRDHYPHSFILNQVVWPHSSGEVCLQNYNSVLSLSHLYRSCDAILLLNNDNLNKICSQLLGIKNVGFKDMNRVIGHQLASAFEPAYIHCDKSSTWSSVEDTFEHLVAHPEFKLLTSRSVPQTSERSMEFSTYNWPSLLKYLRQMLIADSYMDEGINWHLKIPPSSSNQASASYIKSISNQLILRGKDSKLADCQHFKDMALYTRWTPPSSVLSVLSHPHQFLKYEKSATLLSNCQSPVKPLGKALDKGWQMFAMRAYVHWYTRYGMMEEDFIDSFASLKQVHHSYATL